MPEFKIPEFNRRYVLIPMLAAIALVAAVFFISESNRAQVINSAVEIRQAQERLRVLAELAYATADAESEQWGYLLTGDQQYLAPYSNATQRISESVKELLTSYQQQPQQRAAVTSLNEMIQRKLAASVTQPLKSPSPENRQHTQERVRWMTEVRATIEDIRSHERAVVYKDIQVWQNQHALSGVINASSSVLIVILLMVAGAFITRDIERRNAAVNELDQLVSQRTLELSALSTHLQGVTEREKYKLARELHDELGGLLVSMKMDLAQIAKKLDVKQPDIQVRWQRIQAAINAGVELKRRVIEELRPTLLDNMGLVAALRWQAEQSCEPANVRLQATFPDDEPVINTDKSIAVFRVAQEALTNMVKHARAKVATLTLSFNQHELQLCIEDDGVGLSTTQRASAVGSHGLLSMKHRIHAIGGTFYIGPATPTGTKIMVRVPLDAVVAEAVALRA